MKKKFLITFLFSFAFTFSILAQSRIILTDENCSSLSEIWLSNVDLTAPMLNRINKPEKISNTFSAKKTLNLYINLYWPKNDTQHIVTLKFYTPSGHLYEEKKVPISINGEGPKKLKLPGYRFPEKVLMAKSSPNINFNVFNHKITSIPFPIGGTYISKNRLFGIWKVKIYVDSNKSPCTTVKFKITE